MRKTNEQSLGEVIRQWIKENNVGEKITEVRITTAWEKTMGHQIQALTQKLVYKNKVLTVYLRSAPLRQELTLAKTKIIHMLNKETGKKAIEDIVFI